MRNHLKDLPGGTRNEETGTERIAKSRVSRLNLAMVLRRSNHPNKSGSDSVEVISFTVINREPTACYFGFLNLL